MRKQQYSAFVVVVALSVLAVACSSTTPSGKEEASPGLGKITEPIKASGDVKPAPTGEEGRLHHLVNPPADAILPSSEPDKTSEPTVKPTTTAAPPQSPQPTVEAKKSPPPASDASRKAISWYYMKKKKGEVPNFPADIKQFKPNYKVAWVGTGKKVYLTFDTGGPLGDVDKMLKTLKDNDVKANYFLAGYNVKAHPDFLRRLVDEGHVVANHTMSHKDLTTLSDNEVKKEIEDYEKMYTEITGKPMQKFFRFPYGIYSMHLLDLVSGMGYTSFFWSTAMVDWEPRKNGADDPFNDIMNNLHDGNIILMHQGSEENIDALDRIIKAIKKEGYEFSVISDLSS